MCGGQHRGWAKHSTLNSHAWGHLRQAATSKGPSKKLSVEGRLRQENLKLKVSLDLHTEFKRLFKNKKAYPKKARKRLSVP